MVVTSSLLPRLLSGSFGRNSSDIFSNAEEQVVTRLATISNQSQGMDIKTAAGSELFAQYLASIEAAAHTLKLEPAPRQYRATFPLNYRALFPEEVRCYRADVLEASLEHYNVIWVNGEKFEFSEGAATRAEALQCAWMDLEQVLNRWIQSSAREPCEGWDCGQRPLRPKKVEVSSKLNALDSAWAGFEERYISELAEIEIKARSIIVQAIEYAQRMTELEKRKKDSDHTPEYLHVQKHLVVALNRLNSVANIHRKGRDDLPVEILTRAKAERAALSDCNSLSGKDQCKRLAAKILADDVVESLAAMRIYLCEVGDCLERVDPHLGNNEGLVQRLVDWEESWEVGSWYLLQPPVLDALCDTVFFMREVQGFVPKLTEMLEDTDVEFFLVVPRLVWLRFLISPVKQTPLLARLLPHRFADQTQSFTMEPELQAFSSRFTGLEHQLTEMTQEKQTVRDLFAKRLVYGDENAGEVFACLPSSQRTKARDSVEALMNELESWSMQLQRHCPEDWNQYMAVLTRCLNSGSAAARSGPFGV